MRRFYAAPQNFDNHVVTLDAEETKHLRNVLRLSNGDEVSVFDGEGNEFLCLVREVGVGKGSSVLRVLKKIQPFAPESNLDLTLAVALLKNEKFDLVVQKAVEIGVTKLVPVSTKRADARNVRLERWRKITVDATKQSGRAKLMQITELVDFAECLENQDGAKILFAEKSGESFSALELKSKKLLAVIGAEGGWEDSEIELARKHDFQIVTFAGRILRAETAAIAIAAVLQNKFGDFN